MKTFLHKKAKTCTAIFLIVLCVISFMNFGGFAITPNEKNANSITQNTNRPSGATKLGTTDVIQLPENATITFYEEFGGVANQYSYLDENDQEQKGTFSADTLVLNDTPESHSIIKIFGNVYLQCIASKNDIFIQIESESSLTLQAKGTQLPLEGGAIDIIGASDKSSKMFVHGAENSKTYDVVASMLSISLMKVVEVTPNAVLVAKTFNLEEASATFKVGASLPVGEVGGVRANNVEIQAGGSLTVESTDLPENALYVQEDVSLNAGNLNVTGGHKNAISVSGTGIHAGDSSIIYAKATAPGSTGILHEPVEDDVNSYIDIFSSGINAEGADYGMRVPRGGVYFIGENEAVDVSTFKGSVAALFVKSWDVDDGIIQIGHTLNLILANDNPNALGALYFDPNNSSSQIFADQDAKINAISENQSFQGAAVTVADGFIANERWKAPILLYGNAQINTIMPTHQGAPLWAIKTCGIEILDPEETAITHTYTDKVTIGRTPSFPYDALYNITDIQWSTDPAGANLAVNESGFSTLADVMALTLSGTTKTLPEIIIAPENANWRIIYSDVSLVATVQTVITLDPMGGEVQGGSIEAVVGEAIGVLPVPTHPTNQFLGWFTEKDGQGEEVSESYVVTDTTTLYAFWKTPDPETTLPEMTTVPIETTTSVVETTTSETGGTNPVDPPSAGDKGLAVTATVLALGVCAIILFRKKNKNIVE